VHLRRRRQDGPIGAKSDGSVQWIALQDIAQAQHNRAPPVLLSAYRALAPAGLVAASAAPHGNDRSQASP